MSIDTTSSEEVVARPELAFDPESPAEGTRIVEFEQGNDTFRIQIGADERFTFGAFSPGGKGYGGEDSALRVYKGATKENQIAVFRNVKSVRDISVKVAKLVKTKKGEATEEVGPDGSKRQSVIERGAEWVAVGGGGRTDDIPF